MILFKKGTDLRNYLDAQVINGNQVGFIPTMGALHEGHIFLVKTAKERNTLAACSIFVNPTQFNDPSDLEKYPVTLEEDIHKLEKAGCDLLFLPSVDEVYPKGMQLQRKYELGYLETVLEGKYRPGHFQGVCQVVDRLLEIVKPSLLFLGQKDYQQCLVIKRMLELTARNDIELIICPTQREPDGLAMSSRNLRLNQRARDLAPLIHQSLESIKDDLGELDIQKLKLRAIQKLENAGFKVDYVDIVYADTLLPEEKNIDGRHLVALAAAFIDEVRLIDNIQLN